jgi:hypothetical protein
MSKRQATATACHGRADPAHIGRPAAVPIDAVRVVLPHSEVCMHIRIAGQTRWVAPVGRLMAQVFDDDGSRYSAPITRGEAGLTDWNTAPLDSPFPPA